MNGFSECKAPFGVHPLHCSAPERTELQRKVLERAKRCSADPRISTSRRIAERGLNIDDLVQHIGLLFFDVLRTAKSEFKCMKFGGTVYINVVCTL